MLEGLIEIVLVAFWGIGVLIAFGIYHDLSMRKERERKKRESERHTRFD